MEFESEFLGIPWSFVTERVIKANDFGLAQTFSSGWFVNSKGQRLNVSTIDVKSGKLSTREPSTTGTGTYYISSLAGDDRSNLFVPLAEIDSSLITEVGAYKAEIEAAKQQRIEEMERREAARLQAFEEQQRKVAEEARVEQQRIQREEQRKQEQAAARQRRKQERTGSIIDLEMRFQEARGLFLERTRSIFCFDLDGILPDQLDWEEVLLDPDDQYSIGISIESAINQVEKIRGFFPSSPGNLLKPCGALRKLLEPQVVAATGDVLHSRRFAPIAPTYAGALMDLELYTEAFSACMVYWPDIELDPNPKYLASAFHRACKNTNNLKKQHEVERFAESHGIQLTGTGQALPTHLRPLRAEKLKQYRELRPNRS